VKVLLKKLMWWCVDSLVFLAGGERNPEPNPPVRLMARDCSGRPIDANRSVLASGQMVLPGIMVSPGFLCRKRCLVLAGKR
jgi:hypothetical protein